MKRSPIVGGLIICVLAVLQGCAVQQIPSRPEPEYRPVWPSISKPQSASASSLYSTSNNMVLFTDSLAREIGDVVTIMLEESTRSSKSAETTISKESNNQILNPKVFGSVVRGVGANDIFNSLDSSTEFSGEGDSDQSKQFDRHHKRGGRRCSTQWFVVGSGVRNGFNSIVARSMSG